MGSISTPVIKDKISPQNTREALDCLSRTREEPKHEGEREASKLSHFIIAYSAYHLKSIWLFTFSDLKTIILPETSFGVVSAISAQAFDIEAKYCPSQILRRTLIVAYWTWINLLPFAIDNQRQSTAILEDGLNKPWRPMPSKRLTQKQAKHLMFILYLVAFLTSVICGGLEECISLMVLGFWYNDCGGADISWVTRNFINACGFICYSSGAMKVALGSSAAFTETKSLLKWFLIIGGVIFSTIQTQDMSDQAGDSLRGRKTVPLVFGDSKSRWITSCAMVFWSLVCPWYWDSPLLIRIGSLALGVLIIYRTLAKRSVKDDKRTFKIWNMWVVGLYILPLVKCTTMG